MAGAGLWIGGLLQFTMLLPQAWRALDGEERQAFLAAAIPRFSVIAVISVTAIVGTGVADWALLSGDVNDTATSAWGQALIVKSALLLPLLGLGAANLLLVGPSLRRGVASAAAWAGRFRVTVGAELLLGAVVLGAASFLTNNSPPYDPSEASEPEPGIEQTVTADDLEIDLSIRPGAAGPNQLALSLTDLDGDEAPVQRLAVRFKYLDEQLGETEDLAETVDESTFALSGSQLSLPGAWRITVIVRREGLRDARATFEVDVPATTGPP
jgi:copper transport protein